MGEASRVPREYSYTSGIRCDPDTRKVTSNLSTKCGAGVVMLAAHDVYLLPWRLHAADRDSADTWLASAARAAPGTATPDIYT